MIRKLKSNFFLDLFSLLVLGYFFFKVRLQSFILRKPTAELSDCKHKHNHPPPQKKQIKQQKINIRVQKTSSRTLLCLHINKTGGNIGNCGQRSG